MNYLRDQYNGVIIEIGWRARRIIANPDHKLQGSSAIVY